MKKIEIFLWLSFCDMTRFIICIPFASQVFMFSPETLFEDNNNNYYYYLPFHYHHIEGNMTISIYAKREL